MDLTLLEGGKVKRLIPDRMCGTAPAVLLINPKYPHNVGTVLRACSCYGIEQLWYTGDRVSLDASEGYRLPREERMKGYRDVRIHQYDRPFDMFPRDAVPVAVELVPGTESLPQFEHPANAVYVFGPEDGGLKSYHLRHCQRFVAIPSRHCLNLAAAVYTVLYDRQTKLNPGAMLAEVLCEKRAQYA